MNVLGVHIGHDSGACLVRDGELVAAVNEERFTRVKHDGGTPTHSVQFCLDRGQINLKHLHAVAVSSSPHDPYLRSFFCLNGAHSGLRSLKYLRLNDLRRLDIRLLRFLSHRYELKGGIPLHVKTFPLSERTELIKVNHHLAHAASAYYTSGFTKRTLIISADGLGDGISTAVWLGENGRIRLLRSYGSNGSLGWFYGSVTEALGWWIGDGEGKTMGLACYGNPDAFDDAELKTILPRYDNGRLVAAHTFADAMPYKVKDTYLWHQPDSAHVVALIDKYGSEAVAAKAQRLLEEEMVKFVQEWVAHEEVSHLAVAGGLFLNVKLNQQIIEKRIVDAFHVFPNAGDGGLPLGAALHVQYQKSNQYPIARLPHMYTGPGFSDHEIETLLNERKVCFRRSERVSAEAASFLAKGKIVGWFQGNMEAGPRALGNRSILFDPRKAENKDILNARVKFREPFRPFCPSIVAEAAGDYLECSHVDRFMVTACRVRPHRAREIPAVVHVDGTVRPQVVEREANERFWQLITEFGKCTGTPVVLNTSFNIKGEPIVCHPRDAIKCFYDTGIDVLILGSYILQKQYPS
jgi:carbamoyltransferase